MAQLRIAFVGRGGTGKTTLTRSLSQELDLPLIVEQIRSTAENMNIGSIKDIDWHTRNALQIAALSQQAWHERFLASRIRGFVSDRSVFDYLAYYTALVARGHQHESALVSSYRRVANGAGDYTHVFLVPAWSRETPNDGFRFSDPEFREIESDIEDYLASIPGCIRLTSIDPRARVEECLSYIRRPKT